MKKIDIKSSFKEAEDMFTEFRKDVKELFKDMEDVVMELTHIPPTGIYHRFADGVLSIDMPGFEKSDINVDIKDGYLRVRANRTVDDFKRSFSASYRIDGFNEEKTEASYNDGILKVILLPTSPPGAKKVQVL